MVKKSATERIEKAKEKYGLAEQRADSFLKKWTDRLIDHPYTLGIVVVVCAVVLVVRFWP